MKRLFSAILILLLTVSLAFGTVSTSTSRIKYNANGVTVAFPFTFGVGETEEIEVILATSAGVETVLTETTHYTVDCTNDDCESGGTVTTVATYATGNTITVLRNVPVTQETDFTEGMPALYETFEDGLDKGIRIDQQQQEEINRTAKLSKSSAYAANVYTLPDPVAGASIGWDSSGSDLTTYPLPSAFSTTYNDDYCYPDYHEADQGVVGSLSTINSCVDGYSTNNGTIYLRHNSGSATTIYTLSTSETIGTTIQLVIENGALISIDTGKTLTINGPFSAGLYQVFSGAGSVVFGFPINIVEATWFQDYTDDAGISINAAIASLSNGGIVSLPAQDVTYETPINITGTDRIRLQGKGSSTILRADLNTVAIDITGSTWSTLADFQLVGGGGTLVPKVGVLYAREDGTPAIGGIGHKTFNFVTDGTFTVSAIYNYATEEGRHYNLYLVNRGAYPSYWTTLDNDGVGENIASPYVTIATGDQSNSENRFYGCSFLSFGGAGTNTIRMRGSIDCTYDGMFLYNPSGNSYFYIDNNTVSISSSQVVISNFRGELGGTGPDYGFHVAGTVNLGGFNVTNGRMNVEVKTFYVEDDIAVTSTTLDFGETGNAPMDFYTVDTCDIEYGGAITVRSTLTLSNLVVNTATLTVATSPSTNYIRDILTGAVTVRAPFTVDAAASAYIYIKAAGVTKWTIRNTPSGHPLSIASATGTRFIIAQDGIKYVQYAFIALDNSGTPSVLEGYAFQTAGTVAITAFDDGVIGQVIVICALHNITITDNAAILLDGGANFAMNSGDTLTLIKGPTGVWLEIGRGNNN